MLLLEPQWETTRRSGRVDPQWLHTAELPDARAFSRGYDRAAVDGLLEDCADTIAELTAALRLAEEEMAELRRQARTRVGRQTRSRGIGQRREPARRSRYQRARPAA